MRQTPLPIEHYLKHPRYARLNREVAIASILKRYGRVVRNEQSRSAQQLFERVKDWWQGPMESHGYGE